MWREVTLLALALVLSSYCEGISEDPNVQRARNLQSKFPLIDGHNDVPWQYRRFANDSASAIDFAKDDFPEISTNIPRLRQGYLGAQFWSVFVDCERMGRDAVRATMEQVDFVHKLVARYSDSLQLATSSAEIQAAFSAGKIASLIGIEGGHSIDASLGALRMFYKLGARYMTLTHTCNNEIGDASANECIDEIDCRQGQCVKGICTQNQTTGLTSFGIRVVNEMNRIGMLVDISHVNAAAMRVTLKSTKAPVIFSHSCAFTLCNNPRNVPDDVLLALKNNGGIVMVAFVPYFVWCNGSMPTTKEVADHIDYIVYGKCPGWFPNCNTRQFPGLGVDHVGIGADYEGTDEFPIGLENPSKYIYLTAELLRRGYKEEELSKIIGGNLLRVFAQVEKVSRSLSDVPPDDTMIFPQRGPQKTCRTNTIP